MSPVFTINFRREVYQRELAHARRRIALLGVWVTYFGVLGLILGLYALNCDSLQRRVTQVERQTTRLKNAENAPSKYAIDASQLSEIEQVHMNTERWRDRLVRLAALLPSNAALVSIAVNPDNLPDPAAQKSLEIVGHLRGGDQDRTRVIVGLVTTLQQDSIFSAGYQNVRLASSRSAEGSPSTTEFVIECR